MNYHEYNDAKGRDARRAVEQNRADRAVQALPFEGTLYMSKWDLQVRRREGAFNGRSIPEGR